MCEFSVPFFVSSFISGGILNPFAVAEMLMLAAVAGSLLTIALDRLDGYQMNIVLVNRKKQQRSKSDYNKKGTQNMRKKKRKEK